MRPVSPVLPAHDAEEATFVGKGHEDLPVILDNDGAATSRWLLTAEEIEQVVRQGYIYVRQLGAKNGVQPIQLSVEPPIVVDDGDHTDPVLEQDEISFK